MATEKFEPRMDILPKAQKSLWPEFADMPEEFTLYGGTAIALHLGHRESVDFDFFGAKEFDPIELAARLPFMKGATVTQSAPNTLGAVIDKKGIPVKISFFGLPGLPQLEKPHIVADTNLKIASLLDLAGMKAAVVQKRAEKKDYLDIDAILSSGRIGLLQALAAGQAIYGDAFSPQNSLKALCYFKDGNVHELSDDVKTRLVKAATEVDLGALPVIKPFRPETGRGNGM